MVCNIVVWFGLSCFCSPGQSDESSFFIVLVCYIVGREWNYVGQMRVHDRAFAFDDSDPVIDEKK